MLHSLNGAQLRNLPAGAPPIPCILPVNTVVECELSGEAVVAIGTAPSGFVALLSPASWAVLRAYKLNRLTVSGQGVKASGKGCPSRPLVGRFITNAATSHVVRYRNGSMFDLRLSNLAVVPRSLVTWAKRPASHEVGDVTLRDGRMRSRRKPTVPSARQRLAAAMAQDDHDAFQ